MAEKQEENGALHSLDSKLYQALVNAQERSNVEKITREQLKKRLCLTDSWSDSDNRRWERYIKMGFGDIEISSRLRSKTAM